MNISFKEVLDHPAFEDEINKDADLRLVCGTLLRSIAKRVIVLREEIDAEEISANNLRIGIIIYLRDHRLEFLGYSTKLALRIKGCLNDGSIEFEMERLREIIKSRYN